MKTQIIFTLLLVMLVGTACGNIPPTPTSITAAPIASTATTVPTETQSPEPITITISKIIESVEGGDGSGVSFAYPAGWYSLKEANGITISNSQEIIDDPFKDTFANGECKIVVFVTSLNIQTSPEVSGDPVRGIESYTLFAGINAPDKEPAHMIELNEKEFAFGSYSETEAVKSGVPVFMAMHFSETNTIVFELYSSPADEAEFREIFEDLLSSIETY